MNKGGVRPLVIYGTGDTATLVYSIAIEAGIEVAAFTSDALDARMDTELPPFVAKSDLAKEFPPEQYDMAMGFIGKDLQKTREEKYCEMLNKGYRFPNVVQPGAHVSGMLGKGNIVMAGAVVGPRCSIADCNRTACFRMITRSETSTTYRPRRLSPDMPGREAIVLLGTGRSSTTSLSSMIGRS